MHISEAKTSEKYESQWSFSSLVSVVTGIVTVLIDHLYLKFQFQCQPSIHVPSHLVLSTNKKTNQRNNTRNNQQHLILEY